MIYRKGAIGATAVLLAIAACGTGGQQGSGSGATCDNFTLAALDDDSHRTAYYAIDRGHVTSDVIGKLDVEYMQIPALIQATGSGQYDVVATSLPGLVQAREKGKVDLRIVGLIQAQTGGGTKTYVRADSPIKTGKDLKGKTVGVTGFGSSVTMTAQLVYTEKYGLNSKQEGGDVNYVELDPQTLLNALEKGDVDAAVLFHQAGWRASKDGKFRVAAAVDQDFRELGDAWLVGAALVTEADVLAEKAACVTEFQRMIRESVAYAEANVASFAGDISKETGVDPEFIKYWWNGESYRFGGTTDAEWVGWAKAFYTIAQRNGYLPVNPDLNAIVVKDRS
ncbi:ABC transporter substrate-binding protein [Nonomuraea sp. NPDC047897]|uniref:ABC transporter substrate-binding protein n=1 Tax=Nonomuraea sp. NPDC047897 TaxID=3364346 RepID=UPI0037205080